MRCVPQGYYHKNKVFGQNISYLIRTEEQNLQEVVSFPLQLTHYLFMSDQGRKKFCQKCVSGTSYKRQSGPQIWFSYIRSVRRNGPNFWQTILKSLWKGKPYALWNATPLNTDMDLNFLQSHTRKVLRRMWASFNHAKVKSNSLQTKQNMMLMILLVSQSKLPLQLYLTHE